MNKILKYDFKQNRRYFFRTIIISLSLLILSFVLHNVLGLRVVLSNANLTYGIFYGLLAYFVGVTLNYVYLSINKDYNRPRSILTFLLPVSEKSYMWAKNLGVAIVYLINLVFVLLIYYILNYKITGHLLAYFFLGLIWILIITNLTLLRVQMTRFNQKKRPFIYVFLLFVLILLVSFVVSMYSSFVLVNGKIQHARPMSYAFIFPFAVGSKGLYLNLTPYILYIGAWLLTFSLAKTNLETKLDLS